MATMASHPSSHAAPNVSGQFDYYVLDMPWGATFCSSVKDTGAGCQPQPGFVVHGLWPQNNNDTWPEFCSSMPAGEGMLANLDLTPDAGLLQHEWAKHGTCSGLSTAAYFAATRKARSQIQAPGALLTATTNSTFTPLFLLNMFYLVNPGLPAGSLSLSCRDGRLLAVEACFSKSLEPVACTGLHSCDENTVQLEPMH